MNCLANDCDGTYIVSDMMPERWYCTEDYNSNPRHRADYICSNYFFKKKCFEGICINCLELYTDDEM